MSQCRDDTTRCKCTGMRAAPLQTSKYTQDPHGSKHVHCVVCYAIERSGVGVGEGVGNNGKQYWVDFVRSSSSMRTVAEYPSPMRAAPPGTLNCTSKYSISGSGHQSSARYIVKLAEYDVGLKYNCTHKKRDKPARGIITRNHAQVLLFARSRHSQLQIESRKEWTSDMSGDR